MKVMKMKLILSTLLVSFSIICCAQNNIPMVGTWKMISGKMTNGDSTFSYDMNTTEAIKIVSPTHFAVFSKDKATGVLEHAGAGTISVSGDQYTETITFATGEPSVQPQIAKFTSKLEGNKWYIVGGLPKFKFDEVWERVK
jgi:hypothetical protein